jgi:hypothetical protein
MKISVVVPIIRENSTLRFLNEWSEIFEKFGYFNEGIAFEVEFWLRIKDKTKWTFLIFWFLIMELKKQPIVLKIEINI